MAFICDLSDWRKNFEGVSKMNAKSLKMHKKKKKWPENLCISIIFCNFVRDFEKLYNKLYTQWKKTTKSLRMITLFR